MNLLLDTHAMLWWMNADAIDSGAAELISDPDNLVAVSAVSFWEIEIKRALGRVTAPEDLFGPAELSGFEQLDVTATHAVRAGRLPPHHRDPFDRMLIAQAGHEGLAIVTRDRSFEPYNVDTVPC